MTASKDLHAARPANQHRSVSSTAGSLPQRQSRPHSHSLSAGSIHSAHRVTRRKSMTSTAAGNIAAMAAAAKGAGGLSAESGSVSGRRASKSGVSPRGSTFPSSVPNNGSGFDHAGYAKSSSAVTDGPPLSSMVQEMKGNSKSRMRRASEGSRLSKGESKRQSGSELRCETCGKGYKHSSCLTKHLWEHTPEWAYTSKLLISKHQQVQLLEAASVLVTMNVEPSATSDHSSASPAASGSSDPREDYLSSTDTTPPPQADDTAARRRYGHSKRMSSTSSVYSRSYQSNSGASVFSESAPNNHSFSHYRQWSADQRPSTSAASVSGSQFDDEDQADLAAAVGLLSCSYSTPKNGPIMLPPDVPPVPPLPARFLGLNAETGSRLAVTPKGSASIVPGQAQGIKDVEMDQDNGNFPVRDVGRPTTTRVHIDDYEDGVFGMEE